MNSSEGDSDSEKLSLDKFEANIATGGGSPASGGSSVGGSMLHSGFGHVGTARRRYAQLARVYIRAGEVSDAVESDPFNM